MNIGISQFFVVAVSLVGLTACTTQDHYLIASTGTTIGVDVSQQQGTQSPSATLGYKRAELAIVPTNRAVCLDKDSVPECAGGSGKGAADTGSVVMELRYGGIFTFGSDNAIYQRLAVGESAVNADGASLMFARANDGSIDPAAAEAIAQAATADAIQVDRRSKETYSKERRSRVDALLDKIDQLSTASAIMLEKNVPEPNDSAEALVKAMDPAGLRLTDGAAARKSLKTRVIYIDRDDSSLKAWEAAIGATN